MSMNSMSEAIRPGNIQTATYPSISVLDLAVAGAMAGALPVTAGDGAGQAMAGAIPVEAGAGAIQAGATAGAGVLVGAIRVGVRAGVIIHPITETIPTGNAMRTIRADSIREVYTMREL